MSCTELVVASRRASCWCSKTTLSALFVSLLTFKSRRVHSFRSCIAVQVLYLFDVDGGFFGSSTFPLQRSLHRRSLIPFIVLANGNENSVFSLTDTKEMSHATKISFLVRQHMYHVSVTRHMRSLRTALSNRNLLFKQASSSAMQSVSVQATPIDGLLVFPCRQLKLIWSLLFKSASSSAMQSVSDEATPIDGLLGMGYVVTHPISLIGTWSSIVLEDWRTYCFFRCPRRRQRGWWQWLSSIIVTGGHACTTHWYYLPSSCSWYSFAGDASVTSRTPSGLDPHSGPDLFERLRDDLTYLIEPISSIRPRSSWTLSVDLWFSHFEQNDPTSLHVPLTLADWEKQGIKQNQCLLAHSPYMQ